MLNDEDREIVKLFSSLDMKHDMYTNFQNFIQTSAIAIANTCYRDTELGQVMEDEYMNIIKQYDKKDIEILTKILAKVTLSLMESPHDCLGEVFMEGGFGSKQLGQFFTPFHISEFMAEINLVDILSSPSIKKRGWFSLSEPACGSGGMIIAIHKTLESKGMTSSPSFWCEARDISLNSFYMTYIQLSLLGIPARVILGDTLAMEERRVLLTPTFIADGWLEKIEQETMDEDDYEKTLQPINIQTYEPDLLDIFAEGRLL